MILVDTSVWVDHLRRGDAALADALQQGQVAMHPFVVGELACGSLRDRAELLGLLQALPALTVATYEEVLHFIEAHALMGRGLGYVDVHLLAAARLADTLLWTRDKRLASMAADMQIAYAEIRH